MASTAAAAPRTLPVPSFYDSANATRFAYRPDQGQLFEAATAWRTRHAVRPA